MLRKFIVPLLFVAVSSASAEDVSEDSRTKALSTITDEERVEAAAMIESALSDSGDELAKAVEDAAEKLGDDSELADRLRKALPDELKSVAKRVHDALVFRPRIEGEQPPGFPALTPIGEVEVKRYPTYRLAIAEMGDGATVGGNSVGPFFRLFRHIQSRSIPMTIPVEMEMQDKQKMQSMAFLYPDTETGETGSAEEDVTVQDVPPMTVVSTGGMGETTERSVADAMTRVDDWLRSTPEYEPAGEFRVLGYNGPMTPSNEKYFEVQRPVKATADSKR